MPAFSVYLEGTRSHNEGCVSTPACYLLLAPRVCTLVLFSFSDRSAFSVTHASFCSNRHTPFIPRIRVVAIFLSAVLQTYAQPLCLPFSLLLWHVSLIPDLFAFFLTTERVWKQHQKLRPPHRLTTSEDAWVVFMSHAACLPGQSSQMCEFSWQVCKFTTLFCDRKKICA